MIMASSDCFLFLLCILSVLNLLFLFLFFVVHSVSWFCSRLSPSVQVQQDLLEEAVATILLRAGTLRHFCVKATNRTTYTHVADGEPVVVASLGTECRNMPADVTRDGITERVISFTRNDAYLSSPFVMCF